MVPRHGIHRIFFPKAHRTAVSALLSTPSGCLRCRILPQLPACGLTSRDAIQHPSLSNQDSRPLNPYWMMFSALATLYFIDFVFSEKVILVGHSTGALVAEDAYFDAPECLAALILVTEAMLALFTLQNILKKIKLALKIRLSGTAQIQIPVGISLPGYAIFYQYSWWTKIDSIYKRALSAITLLLV